MDSKTTADAPERRFLLSLLNENITSLATQAVDQLHAEQVPTYVVIPRETLIRIVQAAMQAFLRDVTEDQDHWFADYWNMVAEARAEQGATLEDMLYGIGLSGTVMDAFLMQQKTIDAEVAMWWLRRLRMIVHTGVIMLARVFTTVRERLIRAQDETIRELLTPIIPIHEGIVILPLIGAIDSSRASQVLETLLNGINEFQASVVLVDITGVPIVDTAVAHHLLQSARAAQLLGAKVVLVGIRPEIAQTIAQLGADLSGIITRSNLEAGVNYALALHGLKIVSTPASQAQSQNTLLKIRTTPYTH